MKVTLTFAGDDQGPKTSLKLELPMKWLDGPMSKLLDTFLTNYNKKNVSTPLQEAHLANKLGEPIPLDTVVGQGAANGEELFIVRGRPSSAAVAKQQNEGKSDDDEEDVTSKAGLERAKQKAKFAFDHSKWDKLDLSDDDGVDCHPNIELQSWKRIKAQQRAERRAKEEAEIQRMREKIAKFEARAKELEQDGSDEKARQEALASAAKYKAKMEEFIEHRKWVAEEVCETKESRSLVNKLAPPLPPPGVPEPKKAPAIGPVPSDIDFDTYEEYVNRFEPLLREFVSIENDRAATERFMVEHPQILNQHADGFLLLLCLDTAMRHAEVAAEKKTPKQVEGEKRELRRVVRQHLMLNYVLELAKLSKVDDVRAAVRPFFLKTNKQTKEQVAEFENELVAFVGRIEARAKEKLSKGEKSPLAKKQAAAAAEEDGEEDYEAAGLGPGGLDPNEVLPTLPKAMQDAFVAQDVAKLKEVMSSLPPAEADYHLKRCIDSGLWVVPPKPAGEPDSEDEDDDEEEVEGAEAKQGATTAAGAVA